MMDRYRQIVLAIPALIALTAFGLVACGDDDDEKSGVSVGGSTVRFPPGSNGAIYLSIDNDGAADALLGASTDVAGNAQLHESVTNDGSAQMQRLDRIDVPSGAHVHLEPGGFHIMLMNVDEVPDVGETISVELMFENAGIVTVDVEVVALGDEDIHDDE